MQETKIGQVITFYSYKGGTGRSMALANVACLLARGKQKNLAGEPVKSARVLVIDWDLEAPGLHRFFQPYLDISEKYKLDSYLNKYPGLIDWFDKVNKATQRRERSHIILNKGYVFHLFQSLKLKNFITQIPCIPNLFFMKAGRLDEDYSSRIDSFQWEALYNRVPGFFTFFAEYLATHYDYVLIDARTGSTDIGGICTMLMPEKLVVVFTPNYQSLTGLAMLVPKVTTYRRQSDDWRPLTIFPLPSRIDMTRPSLLEYWRFGDEASGFSGYQRQFEELFTKHYNLSHCDLTQYFKEIQIQHVPDYAYGELIAVEEEKGEERLSLSRSYMIFVQRLVYLSAPWENLETARVQYELNISQEGAMIALKKGNFVDAQKYLQDALAIHKKFQEVQEPKLAGIAEKLAEKLKDQGDLEKAEFFLREALEVIKQSLGVHHLAYAKVLLQLGSVLFKQGWPKEARKVYKEAKAIYEKANVQSGIEASKHKLEELDNIDDFNAEARSYEQWAQEQLERALKQLESDNEEDIITACHTLSTLDHPIRLKALRRLEQLSDYSNLRIKRQAIFTMKTILHPE